MRVFEIKAPLLDEERELLRAGDKVLISGRFYTARDKAHKLLHEMILSGKKLPFDFSNSVIYYTGPVFSDKTGRIVSAGPTTSCRMDKYTPSLLASGIKGLIGKGARSSEVINAVRENKGVYFCTIGGAGVYLAQRIQSCRTAAFEELGMEAVYELIVRDFPCYVAVDSRGNTLFR